MLEIAIDHTVLGGRSHDRATRDMRRLIVAKVEFLSELLRLDRHGFWFHGPTDIRHPVRHVADHLHIIIVPVERDPQQRTPGSVAIGRIKRQVAVAKCHVGAMGMDRYRVLEAVLDGFLPVRAPLRCPLGHRGAADRLAAGLIDPDRRSTDKAQRSMIKVIRIEIIDRNTVATGPDERIGEFVLPEEQRYAGFILVDEIASNSPLACLRVVRLADPGRTSSPLDVR